MRAIVAEICTLLASQQLTTATGGNVSVRLPDGTFLVTPSRFHKRRVKEKDIVRINNNGDIVEGTRVPTSEVPMHLAIYNAIPEAGAIIHAHPPYATGYSFTCKDLETLVSSEAYFVLGSKIPLIEYARPSTQDLGRIMSESMTKDHKAYLMANHGVITWGTDIWDAFDILDTLEMYAHSHFVATLAGGAVQLPVEECEWLRKKSSPQG
jgi:L-fuculose-phosphate aldolase